MLRYKHKFGPHPIGVAPATGRYAKVTPDHRKAFKQIAGLFAVEPEISDARVARALGVPPEKAKDLLRRMMRHDPRYLLRAAPDGPRTVRVDGKKMRVHLRLADLRQQDADIIQAALQEVPDEAVLSKHPTLTAKRLRERREELRLKGLLDEETKRAPGTDVPAHVHQAQLGLVARKLLRGKIDYTRIREAVNQQTHKVNGGEKRFPVDGIKHLTRALRWRIRRAQEERSGRRLGLQVRWNLAVWPGLAGYLGLTVPELDRLASLLAGK